MPQWNSTNLSTLPISTQTDADSPVSQALMDKLRLFSEQLLVMGYQTGSSCAIATISTGTNTEITASSSGAADGDHDGRTILITTGLAKGNMYTIDATSSGATYKLTMTGDNLYADGVRDTDSFKIIYDQLVNTDGHDHDGINSKDVSAIKTPFYFFFDKITTAAATYAQMVGPNGAAMRGYFYKLAGMEKIYYKAALSNSSANSTSYFKIWIDSSAYESAEKTAATTGTLVIQGNLDISALTDNTWYEMYFMGKSALGGTCELRRFGSYFSPA